MQQQRKSAKNKLKDLNQESGSAPISQEIFDHAGTDIAVQVLLIEFMSHSIHSHIDFHNLPVDQMRFIRDKIIEKVDEHDAHDLDNLADA